MITPHPAEMARLTGLSIEEVEAERLSLSREIATRYGIGVVLKGHRTVVAWPDGRAAINSSGNPGMATAGTGDVLTGVIAAWLAALESPGRATELAVWLHGRAGDLARDDHGEVAMVAGDLIDRLGDAVREVSGPSPSSPRKGRGA